MISHTPPSFQNKAFHCPFCNVYANQGWISANNIGNPAIGNRPTEGLFLSYCFHCTKYALWINEKVVYPDVSELPLPNADLPDDIKDDYNEAASIASKSPRGAAALLRLAIQKLCKHLGENGRNINDDIASLVQKGLPLRVQQSLDVVRVVGNNAVHPGQIDLDDNRELALNLFSLVNLIADIMITQPKHVDEMYQSLPQTQRDQIERRDRGNPGP